MSQRLGRGNLTRLFKSPGKSANTWDTLVSGELRQLAAARMAAEAPGQTL